MSLKTYGYDAEFHMFGDIIPNEIRRGTEMTDDMRVARRLPEDTAAEIRKASSSWILKILYNRIYKYYEKKSINPQNHNP